MSYYNQNQQQSGGYSSYNQAQQSQYGSPYNHDHGGPNSSSALAGQDSSANPFSSSNQLSTPSPYGYQPYQDDDGRTPELPAEEDHTQMFDSRDPNYDGYVSSYPPNGSKEYANAGREGRSRKKGWVIGGIIGLIIVAALGGGLGYYFSHKDSNDSSSSSSKGSNSDTGTVTSGDPSKFTKNPDYKQSFFGLAYSPIGSQLSEGCSNTIESVIYDMQIMSQLTTQLRGYGADCNQTAQTLQAIHDTKTNLTYWPGIYIAADDDETQEAVYERQVANLTEAINDYGTDKIGGVIVGNEYLLNGGTVAGLLAFVTKFKATAASNNWNFKIGTGDAASKFSASLGVGVDFFMANNHPWFAEVTVEDAPGWTWNYFQESNIDVAATITPKPDMYIGEVGWPSQANDTADATLGGAVASVKNMQYFIDNYACQSTANGTLSFFFEAYDEEWKDLAFGGVEGYWGLFDKNKKLKAITFPDC